MRRRLSAFFLALASALALAAPALADVIWEPSDGFYERHSGECDYVNRRYAAAGYDGVLTLWDAPGGAAVEDVPNGTRGTVQFRWTGADGVVWGYYYGWTDPWDKGGWAPMDDLSLVYDSQSFEEEHASEIVSGEPVPVEFTSAVLYSYPNGPVTGLLEEAADYMPFSQVFSTVYTGEDGLRWGYVNYYMGHVNAWACLDDPENEALDTHVVEPGSSVSQARRAPAVEPGMRRSTQLILAGVLVAAVAAVTLLTILKKGKKS